MLELNKIYCMDCLEGMKEMDDGSVDLVVTDPPYNLGKKYGDFNDSKTEKKYLKWIKKRCLEIYRVMGYPGFLYMSHSDKGIFLLKPMLEKIGFNFIQLLYWVAKNGYGQYNKTRWSYRVEPILFMVKSLDYELISGEGCEWYTSYLEIPRPQSNFKEGRYHPTEKPIKLYRYIISRTPGNIVLDPFVGSGSSAIATKQSNRNFIGFEINPDYVEIANKRLQQENLNSFIQ